MFPLLGGLTFYSQAEFFLPRILLTEQANKLTIQLFVDRLIHYQKKSVNY